MGTDGLCQKQAPPETPQVHPPMTHTESSNITSKRIVKSSAGVGPVYPPLSGVIHVAYPKVWYQTSHPWVWGLGVGGSKLLCVLRLLCADSHLGPEELFSCIWTP